MTISVDAYFRGRKADRKKEPRYIAVINKDSCTSCNSCATMCPVDCIYEVGGRGPSQDYHQIDTTRCIGCQLCYRVPTESTEHYNLEICPWNAIDMLHNPNVSKEEPVLVPYYRGSEDALPWEKLEEYAFQLRQNREVRVPTDAQDLQQTVERFREADWWCGDEGNCALIEGPFDQGNYLMYRTTPEGDAVFEAALSHYEKVFLD